MNFKGDTKCGNKRRETECVGKPFQMVGMANVEERRTGVVRIKGTCMSCLSDEHVNKDMKSLTIYSTST